MKKTLLWVIIVISVLVASFFAFNSYIYNEKQADQETPINAATSTPVTQNPDRPTQQPYDAKRLEAKNWTWLSVTYNDGTTIIPKQSLAFTLDFNDDGTFSATTDCNRLAGQFIANKGAITFSNISATKMFCEASQEADYLKVLERSAGYLFTNRGELVLDIERDTGSALFR